MTNCISGVLQTAANISGKEIRQILKPQSPAEIFVQVLLNAGAAELEAHLQIMFIQFPGKPVYELDVGVHAMPRIGGIRPGLGEKGTAARRSHGHKNDGQAGIRRARS